MRLATFNVENMFERVKAMNMEDWEAGAAALEDFKVLNTLIQKEVYSAETKDKILKIMAKHKGLIQQQVSKFIILRVIRGKFISKKPDHPAEVVAEGRESWIGWFELVKEDIKNTATENTGRIIGMLNADVQCLIEVENRTSLRHFNEDVLPHIQASTFNHLMLIDGNDTRGIDVGIMTRGSYEILGIYSHVDDTDEEGIIFSRDCAEYQIKTETGNMLLVLINHFKSKGYGGAEASAKKRLRQARRVREIYNARSTEGYEYIAVLGDLNETPDQPPMDPLIREASPLIDIMAHPKFIGDGRPGTHGNGTMSAKLDYILLSPKLSAKVVSGGIERRGVWGGKNGKLFPHLPTILKEQDSASDHAALWVDLAI